MKTRPAALPAPTPGDPPGFPGTGELAALRAWYTGLAVRPAVERYLPSALGNGQSARGVLGRIRRKLVTLAHTAHRGDLATLPGHPTGERQRHAKAVAQAIDTLRTARAPQAHRITTLAELTVRIPRRRQWWKAVPGLGVASARAIEA
ncbi:phage integrase family protein, partial [Paraburkholderia humisilvae]|uniref:phage integrase family protein n=1 Tax=Paraburkholderia humisilvae TaxID=627669 RepID=UPI00248347E3